jgi:cytochrome c biogenesis protein CcmG/thiol:disulfide interchange protein DsbE
VKALNRFVLPLGGFALLVLLLAIGLRQAPDKGIIVSPLIGKPAPALRLPLLNEPAVMLDAAETFRGRWYLLNVWGTWCPECRYELKALTEISQRYQIPVLGMDWKDDDAAAREWLQQLGNPYEQVVTDHEGRTAIAWGVYGAPETYLINPAGIIVHKKVGGLTLDIWQREFLPLMTRNGS